MWDGENDGVERRAVVSYDREMSSGTQTKPPRMVHCVKLQRDLPGLEEIPFEGHPLGQRIYDNVSQEAWKGWVEHMKMMMNEYRLNLGTKEAQEFLLQQMENYFFGSGATPPPDYVPPTH